MAPGPVVTLSEVVMLAMEHVGGKGENPRADEEGRWRGALRRSTATTWTWR